MRLGIEEVRRMEVNRQTEKRRLDAPDNTPAPPDHTAGTARGPDDLPGLLRPALPRLLQPPHPDHPGGRRPPAPAGPPLPPPLLPDNFAPAQRDSHCLKETSR